MRKSLVLVLLLLSAAQYSQAQVDNYALRFSGKGSVTCGELVDMEQQKSYTLQFWMNPDVWTDGATVFSSGDSFSASLGAEGSIIFKVGDTNLSATATQQFSAGKWTQVTLVCNDGTAQVFANDVKCGEGNLPAIPSTNSPLIIGEKFNGRLDEMRFWKTALTDEFNYFPHTTLNQFNPHWNHLVAYYKMDQELCENLVDYKGIYTDDKGDLTSSPSYNYHGILRGDARKEKVSDNNGLPYLINGAYTANERFYDRAIPRGQYLLSNDLIILGIQSYSDGHLRYCTPCNHGTLENCVRLDEYQGRQGVLSLDGKGRMRAGRDALQLNENKDGKSTGAYAFDCWIYLDEWTEGAYLFRKENEEGTEGLSIRLGDAAKQQVIVRVDGRDYGHGGKLKVGEWTHFGIATRAASSPTQQFGFIYNGKMVLGKKSMCNPVADNMPTNTSQFDAFIGEGLKGKMDDVLIWNNRPYDEERVRCDMQGNFLMPGIGKEVTADLMHSCNSLWKFDKEDQPGYDSYSQDEWLAIMKSAYEGYRGARFRISVKSHDGWENTIGSKKKREIFAADLAELSKPYDGVELDLEWASSWYSYGLLAEEIRKALPADKSFEVSVHAYNYNYPKEKIGLANAFTVQQYGPQKQWFYFSRYKQTLAGMEKYGYPKEKIYASYSTTTSGPYRNGAQQGHIITGVRKGLMDGDFVPQEETDVYNHPDGSQYYFTGPLQTYRRAKYVTDHLYRGIFYWDMGNDVPVEHPYNLAKWCSYGLNANVDKLVTHVDVIPYESTGISNVEFSSQEMEMKGEVQVYNMIGTQIAKAATFQQAVSMLPSGMYLIKGKNYAGRSVSMKLKK